MENKEIEQSNTQLIPLQKYVFQAEELAKERKKRIKLKKIFICVAILTLIIGYLVGSIIPSYALSNMRYFLQTGRSATGRKIEAVLEIMKNDWFFGQNVKNISGRLEDQALKGITTNKEDPHTEYMTKAEMAAFSEQLKRQYVGIGIQFLLTNGKAMVQKVFRHSPAEKAGIQVGDIIAAVDQQSLVGKNANDIKKMVMGVKGKPVVLTIQRANKEMSISVIRDNVLASTYGKVLTDNTGYIELFQFAENTHVEVQSYLDEFKDKKITNLIIDLRDNGGGYLTTLKYIASFFLPDKTLVMKQEYANHHKEEIYTKGKPYENIKNIVILVNQNTASASEVLTLAIKEQRKNVTVIGTKTYGKGTVQISQSFKDGSAIKYTTSKWLSPKGEWINGKGITPDITVSPEQILTQEYPKWDVTKTYLEYDSVSSITKYSQMALAYLGYKVLRQDGYFDQNMVQVLSQFQKDMGLTINGKLDKKCLETLISKMVYVVNTDITRDKIYQKALEVLRG